MDERAAKIPVWLDCDPGHDDAFAILLAAYHPAIELLGISTVHGNSSITHTTENAGSVLTAIGRPEIPVYAGASEGLTRPAVHASMIHGESGLDGTRLLPHPAVPPMKSIPTIDAIAKALFATPPETAWLIATGTLTNIAQLFTKFPTLADHIKGLSIMGGAIGDNFTSAPLGSVNSISRFGNWTPYAEFNIVVDPEAAQLIFSNPSLTRKTILIPLDVTHLVLATPKVQTLLLHGTHLNSPLAAASSLRVMFVELVSFFANTYASVFGITAGPPLHDPLAVAVILDGILGVEIPFWDYQGEKREEVRWRGGEGWKGDGKGSFARRRYEVRVLTEGTHEQAVKGEMQTGRTLVRLLAEGEEGVRIPRGLDVERFWIVIEECLGRADVRNAVVG